MKLTLSFEQETDGRWIAEVLELPVLVYGETPQQAGAKALELAFWMLSERQGDEDLPTDVEEKKE